MKFTITIISLLIVASCYAQLDQLKGTWISTQQDVLVISDTLNTPRSSNMLCTAEKDENMSFYLIGDTLSFQKRYYSSATNYTQLYIDRYDLIIVSRTDTSINVRPVSDLSKEFFNNRTSITFIKQEYNVDRTINFEKIIYHTTTCLGNCPEIDLEIRNDKSIYVNSKVYIGDWRLQFDSSRSGTFAGKLSDTLYNELIHNLQTCNLRTLTFPEKHGADAPVTTMIIYYNGQRKYLKSMFPPAIAYQLINYLFYINTKATLTRTDEKRTLEK